MANISAFQANDASSILAARTSIYPYLVYGFYILTHNAIVYTYAS